MLSRVGGLAFRRRPRGDPRGRVLLASHCSNVLGCLLRSGRFRERHIPFAAGVEAAALGVPFSFTAHAYDIHSTAPRVRNDTLAWKVRHASRVIAISAFGVGLAMLAVSVAYEQYRDWKETRYRDIQR